MLIEILKVKIDTIDTILFKQISSNLYEIRFEKDQLSIIERK